MDFKSDVILDDIKINLKHLYVYLDEGKDYGRFGDHHHDVHGGKRRCFEGPCRTEENRGR